MTSKDTIYIVHHQSVVGSAIGRQLLTQGYSQLLLRKAEELDLRLPDALNRFFGEHKPQYVVLPALTDVYPPDVARQVQLNIVEQSRQHGVRKLLFVAGPEVHAAASTQPVPAGQLASKAPEAEAQAQLGALHQCGYYAAEYECNFQGIVAAEVYGPGDDWSLTRPMALPSLVRKLYLTRMLMEGKYEHIRRDLEANPIEGQTASIRIKELLPLLRRYGVSEDPSGGFVELPGTGQETHQLLHADDLARACLQVLHQGQLRLTPLHIAPQATLSAKELSQLVARVVGFRGDIEWQGEPLAPRPSLLASSAQELDWTPQIELGQGIHDVLEAYTGIKIPLN